MSMICSALAVDTSLVEYMRADEDLVQGVTSLAYKRLLDQLIERHNEQQSPAQQAAARERRLQAEADTLRRLPARFADQFAKTLALRERASMLNVGVATSVQKEWDALNRLFALAGGSLFSGTPFGPDLGYGPAILRLPSEVSEFSRFLDGPGAEQLRRADMQWLRQQLPYAWPGPGDATVADEELVQRINPYFESLRCYVADAAKRGDGLLIWVS